MRPAAHLAAAIEVLDAWQKSEAQADEVLAAWGRAHRFAGAKDRAAIAAHVYTVFRRYAAALWRMGSDVPRALLLGALREDVSVGDIEALFTGQAYAPSPLSVEECAALAAAIDNPPNWVRYNYPQWLEPMLLAEFGDALAAEMAALNMRAPLDLRVNTLKTTREAARAALAASGLPAVACPYAPHGLRLPAGNKLTEHPLHKSGAVEIQDEGSQLASLFCGAKPGMLVIDLCAGAGGKSLAFAAEMRNEGRILACDADEARLARSVPRTERAGVRIVEHRVIQDWAPQDGGPDPDFGDMQDRADLVVVDAPCSGSGTWRRAPDARWRLTAEALQALTLTQSRLLERASSLVRPGGRLVYVTCSVLPVENQAQIESCLVRDRGLALAQPMHVLAEAGLDAISMKEGLGLRLTPARHGTDGFFVACLTRS